MPLNMPLPQDLTAEWFDAIPRRISSRRYDGTSPASALLVRLEETCQRLAAPSGQSRAVLVREAPPEVFTGLIGSYGRVADAPSLVALVGADNAGIEVGYIGEAVVLDATAVGIDSVWIAAAFDAGAAGRLTDLRDGERVHAIAALGHATKTIGAGERLMRAGVRARHRLPLDTIAPGHRDWPAWAREAATAVRLAPSGANKQPWRLHMDSGALVFTKAAKTYWTAPLDFGIAMLHAELGAMHMGVSGAWIVGSGAEVARFVPGPQA
ncbi:MAG TPA: nitroreductase family protein [Coriobacteriia bacterium]|nr:nitroreductase family protein [Coriobacteriia bacterium]